MESLWEAEQPSREGWWRAGGGLAGAGSWHAGSNEEYLPTAAEKMKVKALAG